MTPQWRASSWLTSISSASRLGAIARRRRRPPARSRASARLWAESVETTRVRWPSCAARTAVAAERLVLPDAALARVEDDARAHEARAAPGGRAAGRAEDRVADARRGRAGRGCPPRTRARGRAARRCPPRAGRRSARSARASACWSRTIRSRARGELGVDRAPACPRRRRALARRDPGARGSRRTPRSGISFSSSRRWK